MIFEAKVKQTNEFTMTVEAASEKEARLAFEFYTRGNQFPLTVVDEDFAPASNFELVEIKKVVPQ